MKIVVYCPEFLPYSVRAYAANVSGQLRDMGVTCRSVSNTDKLSDDTDVFWDPTTGGLVPPWRRFLGRRPLVVTEHGAAAFTLTAREQPGYPMRLPLTALRKIKARLAWHAFREKCDSLIAVSSYGKRELMTVLGFPDSQIAVIHHGVDHDVFRPESSGAAAQAPYFLHVSQYQPKKNLDRLLKAYALLPPETLSKLIAIAPGYRGGAPPKGVELISEPLPHDRLAMLYRDAQAFLFPSLHETFGMPILEAMASGCPVITSNSTGCAEVAGDAALLVDPRSIDDIAGAIWKIATDAGLRKTLRRNGLERAQRFTWRRSAEQHLAVFEKVVRDRRAAVTAPRS